MNLKDLILEAGGFTEKHEQYKIEITRKGLNKTIKFIFSNNFVVDMDGNYSIISDDYQDFKLKTNDFITVRSKSYNKTKIKLLVYQEQVFLDFMLYLDRMKLFQILLKGQGV